MLEKFKIRQMMDNLDRIKPIDLMSDKTTTEEVVKWAKDIFEAIGRTQLETLPFEYKGMLSDKLKKLGGLKLEDMGKTRFFEDDNTIDDIISKKNSIAFPLSAIGQLIDAQDSTFNYGFARIFEGREYGWTKKWLKSHNVKTDDEKLADMLKALDKIKPIDLMSDKTTMQEAVQWAKDIFKTIDESKISYIKDENKILVSEKLKELGGLKLSDLKKTKFFEGGKILDDIISKKDSVEFPLSAFAQLIDTRNSTFDYGFAKLFEDEEFSWANEWLKAQEDIQSEHE